MKKNGEGRQPITPGGFRTRPPKRADPDEGAGSQDGIQVAAPEGLIGKKIFRDHRFPEKSRQIGKGPEELGTPGSLGIKHPNVPDVAAVSLVKPGRPEG